MQFEKFEENQKRKSYLTLFLDEKMPKTPQKTYFDNISASYRRFYSIALKFEP
jgi:hypothetical protein